MPTEFSKCDECNLVTSLPLNHEYNKDYVDDLKIVDIFREINIPPEIATKIIKMKYTYNKCESCGKTKLCQKHNDRAIYYGNYYRHYNLSMCSNCCWFEVT